MLAEAWYQNRWWLFFLLPFSLLFFLIITMRRLCYRYGIFKQHQFPVPVIVIGNITVGGTGKTPLVYYLAKLLLRHGYKPGIVMRGYKNNSKNDFYCVTSLSKVEEVGDEAFLLQRNLNIPIVIAKKRVQAAQYLIDNSECDVILSDDGLQHYALARDMEIALIDGQRLLGNRLLLPAGPLRESWRRLQECDFRICNGGEQPNCYKMTLMPHYYHNVNDKNVTVDVGFFYHKLVHAVAGIGNPQRFFTTLTQQGLQCIEHAYPDHYSFSAHDINFGSDDLVIMTEKDAVKCTEFSDHRHWYLRVEAEMSDDFDLRFLNLVAEIVLKKRQLFLSQA
ncbi:MAG: tetraacyldisaccharide 4'-kinase [Legionellales bacterium]|nr:tetraacyldisaccharide 4'-kinase [Legionellales bacterium]